MKIPRRLKEIISRYGSSLVVEHEKRYFALVHSSERRMPVDIGHVVTLSQWDALASKVKAFAKDDLEK